jgi:hypothetical protein
LTAAFASGSWLSQARSYEAELPSDLDQDADPNTDVEGGKDFPQAERLKLTSG